MKILATGDFHGKFPKKFEKIVKDEDIDVVVSNGDYFPFHHRKLWFKHCYGTDTELWEVIGKKKFKELMKKELKDGENSIKKLNALSASVLTVYGNLDYTHKRDTFDIKGKAKWAWDEQDFFSPIVKKYKNIKRIDYSYAKIGDYVFIGVYGGTNPGKVKSKTYRKHKEKLNKLFKKFSKENKEGKVVFVSHNVPYNTKIDKIGKDAHPKVRGKHYGSKLVRRAIDKWQPILHFAGHIHEGKGKDKIGRTVSVNCGSAHENEGAIIEIKDKKVKVRFI